MIALVPLIIVLQQAERSYDPVEVRKQLRLSLLCSDKVGKGGGTIAFLPEENAPTLHVVNGSEPSLFERGYVASGTWKSRPAGGVLEIVLKGVSYGKEATLRFVVPADRSAFDAEARLQIGTEEERTIACLIGPPPPPGASQ